MPAGSIEHLIEDLRLWCLNTSRYAIWRESGVAQTTLTSANSRDTWNPKAATLIALERARARMTGGKAQETHRKLRKALRVPM